MTLSKMADNIAARQASKLISKTKKTDLDMKLAANNKQLYHLSHFINL